MITRRPEADTRRTGHARKAARPSPRGRLTCQLVLLLLVTIAGCDHRRLSHDLVLATTTSVANSGLLDVLLAAFQQQRGFRVNSHLVGSGLALRMLEKGDADVVIAHAPEAEAAALTAHPAWLYRKIMFNDFVLVGPPDDPAGVKGAPAADVAMRRIAASHARFLSRGDQSGTHERENQLWALAGARPSRERLVIAGAGMGTTLRIANETGAYTLTDRATLAQYEVALRLVIVCEGGPLLLNTYAVIVDPSGRRATDAQTFLEWLVNTPGRGIIQNYRVRGVHVFTVWPEGVARDNPYAVPFASGR